LTGWGLLGWNIIKDSRGKCSWPPSTSCRQLDCFLCFFNEKMLPPFMHTNIELKGREWIKVAQHPLSNNCWYLPNYTSSKKKIYTILRYRISINQIGNDLSILTQFQKYFLKTIAPSLFVFIFIYCALLLYSIVFFLKIFYVLIRVLKPGPARRADPGLGPVRVEANICLGIGSEKPSQPETQSTWSTQVRPVNFFLYW
jgi:hypothetical protein